MTVSRGYVIEKDMDDMSDLEREIHEEMIKRLANEYNRLNNEIERRSFISEEDQDNYYDYLSECANDYADSKLEKDVEKKPHISQDEIRDLHRIYMEEYYQEQEKKRNKIYVERDAVEALLHNLGARMMRPYEHWNEDEKYMEYMENRYSDNER